MVGFEGLVVTHSLRWFVRIFAAREDGASQSAFMFRLRTGSGGEKRTQPNGDGLFIDTGLWTSDGSRVRNRLGKFQNDV